MALIRFGKVKVSDLLHFSAVKIQVKHLDHFLRICIKVLGKDTIYRIEELKQSKISAVEYIKMFSILRRKLERGYTVFLNGLIS